MKRKEYMIKGKAIDDSVCVGSESRTIGSSFL
jgi:hypothetical protein